MVQLTCKVFFNIIGSYGSHTCDAQTYVLLNLASVFGQEAKFIITLLGNLFINLGIVMVGQRWTFSCQNLRKVFMLTSLVVFL